ncbi:MAG: hypothetical protein GY729_11765 [Desulfobacteraceae bacterium]|nr:hypothetical protein [Desulfobacteraceae bacterium]
MDIKQLESRWFEMDPDKGATLHDRMVKTLKTKCVKGNAKRPPGLDLRGIHIINDDLSGLDLSMYDISHSNLGTSNLAGTNLSYCNLQGASLEKTILDGCEFLGADLSFASLNECSAKQAGFGGANMSNTSLISSDLSESTLSHSMLKGADFRAANISDSRMSEADLSHAIFTRANLRGSDLKHSDVYKTNFELADLRECRMIGIRNFKKAEWIGTDIRGLDLRGAYFVRRYIDDENYLYEFRSRGTLNKSIYFVWWLTSDCGRSLFRWFVWLFGVTLLFAAIYSVVDVDYGEYATILSPLYFSIVTLTTLGYGDAVPASLTGQIFVIIQAITGYMGLGGLLSILGNKMARRAE